MRCSAVASLLAYFFSRRQARSRFYRALLTRMSNVLLSRIAAKGCATESRALLAKLEDI